MLEVPDNTSAPRNVSDMAHNPVQIHAQKWRAARKRLVFADATMHDPLVHFALLGGSNRSELSVFMRWHKHAVAHCESAAP